MSETIDCVKLMRLIGKQVGLDTADSFYQLSQNDIKAKPRSKEYRDPLFYGELLVLREFERDAYLKLPCTKKEFLAWVDRQGGIDLPESFCETSHAIQRSKDIVEFFKAAFEEDERLKASGNPGFFTYADQPNGNKLKCDFFPKDLYSAIQKKHQNYSGYARNHWRNTDKQRVISELDIVDICFYEKNSKEFDDSPGRKAFIAWVS